MCMQCPRRPEGVPWIWGGGILKVVSSHMGARNHTVFSAGAAGLSTISPSPAQCFLNVKFSTSLSLSQSELHLLFIYLQLRACFSEISNCYTLLVPKIYLDIFFMDWRKKEKTDRERSHFSYRKQHRNPRPALLHTRVRGTSGYSTATP